MTGNGSGPAGAAAAVQRDLEQVRQLLDRLERASPSMARRSVPRMRRRAEGIGVDLARTGPLDQALVDEVARLVRDALAAYEGALVRADGLDGGHCDIAEALLDEIAAVDSDWAGIPAILGTDDSFGPLSAVVHLRYPTDSVWGIPLVAHELGHHVAFALTREVSQGLRRSTHQPVGDLLADEYHRTQSVSAWSHLNEMFADVFATWTAGPAYACALLTLRLDRSRPDEGSYQHPSPSARVAAVLRTLRRLDEVEPGFSQPNKALADRLEGWWRERAGAAVPPAPSSPLALLPGLTPDPADHGTAGRRLDELLAIVERDLAGARHRDTQAARRIEEGLRGAAAVASPPGARVLDVLTAAWRIRSGTPGQSAGPALTRRAGELCAQVAFPRTERGA